MITTTYFFATLFIGFIIAFFVCGLVFTFKFDSDDIGIPLGLLMGILWIIIFCLVTPCMEQMKENDYYAMLEDRPKCIDAGDVSLGCKKDYIDWQKDSIEKQHKYDSVKVKLENLQKEILK